MTDLTPIPSLDPVRLPDGWSWTQLGKIGSSFIGLTYSPRNVSRSGTLVLRSSNVQDSALKFDDNVFVNMAVPDRALVRKDDILICARNGSRALIGKCAKIDERAAGMAFGAFMAVFRTADHGMVFYHLQSDAMRRQIEAHLGATINQITNASLNGFWVPYPQSPKERTAIAAVLSDVDALLEKLDQLIAKKRDLKQAAMQQLLTGRLRLQSFTGQWEVRNLASLGSLLKGRGVVRDQANSGSIACVRYGEIYTTHHDIVRGFSSWISPAVAATATKLKCGDILFAGSGETKEEIGKCVAFIDDIEAYAGGDIVILRPRGVDSRFLGYALNTLEANRQKANFGQGDAVVHISAAALGSVTVRLPQLDEQAAIGTVLADIDTELVALEARRDKIRQLRQGMMQTLLTGRVRLV